MASPPARRVLGRSQQVFQPQKHGEVPAETRCQVRARTAEDQPGDYHQADQPGKQKVGRSRQGRRKASTEGGTEKTTGCAETCQKEGKEGFTTGGRSQNRTEH